jgi:hypothetical protein
MDESPRGADPPPPSPGTKRRLSNVASVKWRLVIWFVVSGVFICQLTNYYFPKFGMTSPLNFRSHETHPAASEESFIPVAGGFLVAQLVASGALAAGLVKRSVGGGFALTILLTAMLVGLMPALACAVYFASCCLELKR